MADNRNAEIDILRSLGIFLIVVAHIKAPYYLTVIRCFDVPLMVFISGLCYGMKPLKGRLSDFYKKRVLRLVVPAWVFLAAMFAFERVFLGYIETVPMIKSFLFYYNGSQFSYMWIIKVFLLIMLVTPFLIKIVSKCPRTVVYLLLFGLIIVEEVVARTLSGCQWGGAINRRDSSLFIRILSIFHFRNVDKVL